MEATTTYRDSRGRFTRAPLEIEYCARRGTFVSDYKAKITHAHRDCPEITNPASRYWTKHTVQETPFWLCSTCVAVPGDPAHSATAAMQAKDERATKRGCARCEACDRMKKATAFPTFEMTGVGWFRDWRVCRTCRKGGVKVSDVTEISDAWMDAA